MKLFEWLKSLWRKNVPEYLPQNYCEGKTNNELIQQLKSGKTGINSGNMIVLELLDRLNIKVENSLGPHVHRNENEQQKF